MKAWISLLAAIAAISIVMSGIEIKRFSLTVKFVFTERCCRWRL